jgi:hypothetical protein
LLLVAKTASKFDRSSCAACSRAKEAWCASVASSSSASAFAAEASVAADNVSRCFSTARHHRFGDSLAVRRAGAPHSSETRIRERVSSEHVGESSVKFDGSRDGSDVL